MQGVSELVCILIRNERDVIINVYRSSCVILVTFKLNLNVLNRVWKTTQISDFMKIRSYGTVVLHVDRQAGRRTDGRMDGQTDR